MKRLLTGAICLAVLSFCLGEQNISKAYVAAADASATLVIGQADLTSNQANRGGDAASNTLSSDCSAIIVGTKLIIADSSNNRVLIYNTVPTSNGTAADVVVGQTDMSGHAANQSGAVAANTLSQPNHVFSDGTKLIISDFGNHRVLIYNSIPTSNNASADVVVGQADKTHNAANQGGAASASTLNHPYGIYYNGTKLFIADHDNSRVLIYNTLPADDNASANVVVGQENMTSTNEDQGGSPTESTLDEPIGVWADNDKLFISDYDNNRVLIYNAIPTSNNASANVVVGQGNMTDVLANQGDSASATTLNKPHGIFVYNSKLYIADYENNRVLVYNSIPTANNTAADKVLGQADMTSATANRGGSAAANTLSKPYFPFANADKLVIADRDNNRVLIYDNQDVTATPSRIKYSKAKGKQKTVALYFYGLSVSKVKKKYYTVRIGGVKVKVKSVKKYSDRVKVRVQYKYGKKARNSYDVSLRYKYRSTIENMSAEDLITIY